MSAPNPKAEWYDLAHDLVDDYCDNFTGEPSDKIYFYEMLKNSSTQNGVMWDMFAEYVNDYCAEKFDKFTR